MICCGKFRSILTGKIAGNTDQTSHITEFERNVALTVCTPACLTKYFINGTPIKVRNLAVVSYFLSDKTDELFLILLSVRHLLLHIHLIAVATDT